MSDSKTQEFDGLRDVSTDPDYATIPGTKSNSILKGKKMFFHQEQTLTKMIEAEDEGPVEDEFGVYYARTGLNACLPGSGKTLPTLALCIDKPFIDVPKMSMSTFSSSLVSMDVNIEDDREYLETSIIISPSTLSKSVWAKNCDEFFGPGKYFLMGNLTDITKDASKAGVDVGDYNDLTKISKEITSIRGKLKRREAKGNYDDEYDELKFRLGQLEDLRSDLKGGKGKKMKVEDLDESVIEHLIDRMREFPIVICPETAFQTLIPIFKRYQVTRLILDELQMSVITNQDTMKNYLVDPKIEFLSQRANFHSYREFSPARFIWLITATPYQLSDKEKSHFFNTWISRNAPFINDYFSNGRVGTMFPAMIARYIIKFPDSYIQDIINGGEDFCEPRTVYIKPPKLLVTLTGLIPAEYESLIENNLLKTLSKKLNYEDELSEKQIINAIIKKIDDEIKEIEIAEQNYKKTNQSLIDKNTAKISKLEFDKFCIERRRDYDFKYVTEDKDWDRLKLCPCCWQTYDRNEFKHIKECKNCYYEFKDKHDYKVLVDFGDDVILPVGNNPDREVSRSKIDAVLDIVLGKSKKKHLKYLIYLEDASMEQEEINLIKSILDEQVDVFMNGSLTIAEKTKLFGVEGMDYLHMQANRKEMQKHIDNFNFIKNTAVFILKKNALSVGLDFPYVDGIICYSNFSEQDKRQIRGRAERANRTTKYKLYTINYDK